MTLAPSAVRHALAALGLCAACALPAFAADYVVTDLGSLGSPRGSGAVALNGHGVAAGYSFVAGSPYVHAMVNTYGTVQDLGTLGGTQSLARAVNQQGWVVGWAYSAGSTTQRAFLWRDGAMAPLGDFGGGRSDASAVNDAGFVVGSAYTTAGDEHGFWWRDGVMTDVGTLGGTTSRVYDINANNVMCGMASPSAGEYRAFVAKPGESLIDLGTLGGEAAHAYAINDLDHVVGWSYLNRSNPDSRAWIFRGAGLEELPTLGGVYGAAFGVNNHDEIVGAASRPDDQQRAVMWRGRQIIDLNSLIPPNVGWLLTRAWDIDESGAIVGEGLLNGEPRGFLITPASSAGVPEASLRDVAFAGATPNPAPGRTRFAFSLPTAQHVRMEVFDASGRRVRLLTDGDWASGHQQVAWDGADESGRAVHGGLYFARLTTRERTLTRRVAVTR